jgi:hypothetical protein
VPAPLCEHGEKAHSCWVDCPCGHPCSAHTGRKRHCRAGLCYCRRFGDPVSPVPRGTPGEGSVPLAATEIDLSNVVLCKRCGKPVPPNEHHAYGSFHEDCMAYSWPIGQKDAIDSGTARNGRVMRKGNLP